MARMKRVNVTLDDQTIRALRLWKDQKEIPASYVIREAVVTFTRWKMKDGTIKPKEQAQSYEGVDVIEDGERQIVYD